MAPCMSATIACSDFLQTSGKWPGLVDHAAALAAHAESAGLARVLGAHGLPQLADAAGFAGFAERVEDGGPAAAGAVFLHEAVGEKTRLWTEWNWRLRAGGPAGTVSSARRCSRVAFSLDSFHDRSQQRTPHARRHSKSRPPRVLCAARFGRRDRRASPIGALMCAALAEGNRRCAARSTAKTRR